MPTVFRENGFREIVRTNDYEPIHVHVFKDSVEFKIDATTFKLLEVKGDYKSFVLYLPTLGAELIISVDNLQGLAGASDDDLSEIELSPLGTNLHWPKLDEDFGVHNLFCGVYGSKTWMEQLTTVMS